MLLELRRWEKETGEKVYVYDTTMQFEGYTGEICQDDYTRVVDTTFPTWTAASGACGRGVKMRSRDVPFIVTFM